jgi:hypothetical protein
MTVTPIDLFASFIRLHQGGQAHAEQQVFDPERDGWQLMAFHVETDADVHADHWEVHTGADEVVSCLTGGIRLYFRPEQAGQAEEEIKLAAGPPSSWRAGDGTASSWTPPPTSCPSPWREAAVSRSGPQPRPGPSHPVLIHNDGPGWRPRCPTAFGLPSRGRRTGGHRTRRPP